MLRRLGFLSLSHLTAPLSKYWKEKQIKKKKEEEETSASHRRQFPLLFLI